MTTETKLGLLLGMGVIILVGIFISDHLSKANSQEPASLATGMERSYDLDESDLPLSLEESRRSRGGDEILSDSNSGSRSQPLPLPEDFEPEPTPEPTTRQTRQTSQPLETGRQQAEASGPEPRITYQDLPIARIPGTVIDGDEPLARQDDLPEELEYVEAREERRFDPDAIARERERERQEAARREAERLAEARRAEEQRRQEREQQQAAQQASASSDSSSSSRVVTHYVRENETLSSIANQYYGNPGYYEVIYEANRETINNPNFVRPGVRLVIPDEAGSVARRQSASSSASSESSASVATQTYTVRENETLSSIAQRFYGSRAQWEALYELNKDRLASPDRLSVGTEILVPVR